MNLEVALIHYPIRDRAGKVVATNVTNLDVHDIARACRVYEVGAYHIVHPLQDQLMFVERMLDHWRSGEGSVLNPMRKTALTMVKTAPSLEEVIRQMPEKPFVVATHARALEGCPSLSFPQLRKKLQTAPGTCLLLWGTGFGLTEDLMRSCDAILEPIRGVGDYRHLSVRSAASICLDRLLAPVIEV